MDSSSELGLSTITTSSTTIAQVGVDETVREQRRGGEVHDDEREPIRLASGIIARPVHGADPVADVAPSWTSIA